MCRTTAEEKQLACSEHPKFSTKQTMTPYLPGQGQQEVLYPLLLLIQLEIHTLIVWLQLRDPVPSLAQFDVKPKADEGQHLHNPVPSP